MSGGESDERCFSRLAGQANGLWRRCDEHARATGKLGELTALLAAEPLGRLGAGWIKDWRAAHDIPGADPRPVLARVVVPVVLASRTRPDLGLVANLVIEAVGGGGGEMYPSVAFSRVARCYMRQETGQESASLEPGEPLQAPASPLDTVASVSRAAAAAWCSFWRGAEPHRAPREGSAISTREVDLRWSLQGPGGHPLVEDVSGDSLGASVARGVLDLLEGRTPDARVVVTAAVDQHGSFNVGDEGLDDWPALSHVGLVRQKVRALVAAGRFDTLVVTSQRDASSAVEEVARSSGSLRVVWFDGRGIGTPGAVQTSEAAPGTVPLRREGVRLADIESLSAEALVTELGEYLAELRSYIEGIPGIYPGRGARGNAGRLRQRVRVVQRGQQHDRQLEKRTEEEERARAAGESWYQPLRGQGPDARLDAESGERSEPQRFSLIEWDGHIWSRFSNRGRIVLLGDPGYGKTTTLCGEALALVEVWQELVSRRGPWAHAEGAPDFPLFARLPDVADLDLSRGLTGALLDNARGRNAARSDAFVELVKDRVAAGKAAIFLDALDEVDDGKMRAALLKAIERFAEARGGYSGKLCVSSRIVGYDRPPGGMFTELELWGFDEGQVDGFVRRWFELGGKAKLAVPFTSIIKERPEIGGLASVPITLALLCRIYEEGDGGRGRVLPDRRTALYGAALERFVEDRARNRAEQTEARVSAWTRRHLGHLENVLVEAYVTDTSALTEQTLMHLLMGTTKLPRKPEQGWEDAEAAAVLELEQMLELGVLVSIGSGARRRFVPIHRTFAEYLVASGLAARIMMDGWERWAPVLDRWAWQPERREVLALLAGHLDVDHAVAFLEVLTRKDDRLHHRLALAVTCAREIRDDGPAAGTERLRRLERTIVGKLLDTLLGFAGRGMESAVPHLCQALSAAAACPRAGRDPFVRRLVAELKIEKNWAAAKLVPLIDANVLASVVRREHVDILRALPLERLDVVRRALGARAARSPLVDVFMGVVGDEGAPPYARRRAFRLVCECRPADRTVIEALGSFTSLFADAVMPAMSEGAGGIELVEAVARLGSTGLRFEPEVRKALSTDSTARSWRVSRERPEETVADLVRMLPAIMPCVGFMVPFLRGDEPGGMSETARMAAERFIAHFGADEDEALLPLLDCVDGEVVAFALEALALSAREAPSLIPRLMRLVTDGGYHLGMCAGRALAATAGAAVPALVPRLANYLRDANWERCHAAAIALGAMGEDAAAAAPSLLAFLEASSPDDLWSNDSHAVWEAAIKVVPPDGDDGLSLIELLTRFTLPFGGQSGSWLLEFLSRRMDRSHPRLEALAEELRRQLRQHSFAAVVLASLEGDRAIPDLLVANGHYQAKEDRSRLVKAWSLVGPSALPTLTEMLNESNGHLEYEAARAIGALGAAGHAALPALIPLVRKAAPAAAIGRMGGAGAAALPGLVEAAETRAIAWPSDIGDALAALSRAGLRLVDGRVTTTAALGASLDQTDPAS